MLAYAVHHHGDPVGVAGDETTLHEGSAEFMVVLQLHSNLPFREVYGLVFNVNLCKNKP